MKRKKDHNSLLFSRNGDILAWNSDNQPPKSKPSSTDPQAIEGTDLGVKVASYTMVSQIGGFHMWTIFFVGEPQAKLEVKSLLFMKSFYFALLFERNHFHRRHVFSIACKIQRCWHAWKLQFLWLEHAMSETDTQIGSPIFPACECYSINVCLCVYIWCDKCGRAALQGHFQTLGVSYLHRKSLAVTSAINDKLV